MAPTEDCTAHTPAPLGYLAWHAWAERQARTHRQRRCPDCGLWAIWTPKAVYTTPRQGTTPAPGEEA
jgi:hypothetical protein